MPRRVVLVCGPPGAGKTTYARSLGLDVYDLDDPKWQASQRTFNAALRMLGQTPNAQAVVIRAGATRSARSKAAATIGATEVQVIATEADTCIQRVIERKRLRPSLRTQIAAVKTWWARYEPGPIQRSAGTKASPKEKTAARGYGAKHQRQRLKFKRQVDAGRAWCWRCGEWIDPAEPWDTGHDDHDRSVYRGPEHVVCNRGTAGRWRPRSRRLWIL